MSIKTIMTSGIVLLSLAGCNAQNAGVVEDVTAKPETAVIKASHVAAGDQTWPLTISVDLDREKCVVNKSEDVFLLVKYEAPEQGRATPEERPDINLSLVLDRSGSMNEKNKMNFVKDAAVYVVDKLSGRDKLGIVEYDDRISELWPLSFVSSPDMVKQLIRRLSPRGSTDLCGGLMRGVGQLRTDVHNDKINRIILLSDGLANSGVTSPAEIGRLTRDARQKGMTISTMGVGLDYNEDLLQMIAENGGGKYYYIENPVQIKEIFQEEISGLFKTVVKNLKVEFKGEAIVDSIAVYGYQTEISGNSALTGLANVYSGEKGMLLIRLRTRVQKSGKQPIGKLTLSYYDCIGNTDRSRQLTLSLDGVKDSAVAAQSINHSVVAEATLIEADNQHEEYVRQFEQGDKQLAQRNMTALTQKIEQANQTLSDVRIRKKITSLQMETSAMDHAEESTANRQAYLKSSKQRFYYAKKGKREKYLMQQGDQNFDVKQLQQKLSALDLYKGLVDGYFSDSVQIAVKKFQKDNGLEDDGIAGPETLKKLGLY